MFLGPVWNIARFVVSVGVSQPCFLTINLKKSMLLASSEGFFAASWRQPPLLPCLGILSPHPPPCGLSDVVDIVPGMSVVDGFAGEPTEFQYGFKI